MNVQDLLLWPVHNAGALIVILGLATEFIAELKRFEKNEALKKRILKAGVLIIILGVAIEIYESMLVEEKLAKATTQAAAAIVEAAAANGRAGIANQLAAQANERSKQLESTNLLLRAELVKLEAAVEWRKVTATQRTNLINLLQRFTQARFTSNNSVRVNVQESDVEARWYAKQIVGVLRECGFAVTLRPIIGLSDPEAEIPLGLGIAEYGSEDDSKPRINMNAIAEAFIAVGIEVRQKTIYTNKPPDGVVIINVWHKPEK